MIRLLRRISIRAVLKPPTRQTIWQLIRSVVWSSIAIMAPSRTRLRLSQRRLSTLITLATWQVSNRIISIITTSRASRVTPAAATSSPHRSANSHSTQERLVTLLQCSSSSSSSNCKCTLPLREGEGLLPTRVASRILSNRVFQSR